MGCLLGVRCFFFRKSSVLTGPVRKQFGDFDTRLIEELETTPKELFALGFSSIDDGWDLSDLCD